MNEKKFTYILFAIAAAAILIVVLVSIPWGGDKGRINREYESLTSNDHVFVSINFDDVMKKINNNETFQVYVGSSTLPQGEQFVFETNKISKQYGIDTVYYLNYAELTDDQITKIKNNSSSETTFPTLIYWVTDDYKNTSTTVNISGLKNLEADYHSNWSELLTEYFENCYE
jgi:hypothetical protein